MAFQLYPWLDHTLPFEPKTLFAPPDFRKFDGGPPKSVCIIGAGIAGLTAAYELMRVRGAEQPNLRHSVSVFEASSRCGGRIMTQRFRDGTYGELGAMRIPGDHVGTLAYIRDHFGLQTRPFVQTNAKGFYVFRGSPPTRISDYDVLLDQRYPGVRSKHRRLPTEVLGDFIKSASAGVVDALSFWPLFEGELDDDALAAYEEVSLYQYLRGKGWPKPPGRLLLNDDEWEWVGRATGTVWMENASMLEHIVEAGSVLSDEKVEIRGGMDRLVEAFSTRLGDRVFLGRRVEALQMTDSGIDVTSRDQFGWHVDHFDFVICAVPAPATLRIQFLPPDKVPPEKLEALSNVSYMSAAKTVVHCRTRLWEQQGIYGGSSFTDLPIQQCWYPNDNADELPVKEDEFSKTWPDPWAAMWRDETPGGLQARATSTEWQAQGAQKPPEQGTFIGAYMWGPNALRFLTLSVKERDQLVLNCLEKLHQGISREVEDIVHMVWDEQASPGCGAFAFFRPGEFRRYQSALCQPLPRVNPRLFFAGEHLAVLHGWIQSSIQTAWSAVAGVLRQ